MRLSLPTLSVLALLLLGACEDATQAAEDAGSQAPDHDSGDLPPGANDAGHEHDSGNLAPEADAAIDAGNDPADASAPYVDAQTPPDASSAQEDAAVVEDAGTSPEDGGTRSDDGGASLEDAGPIPDDAAASLEDAGSVDAGPPPLASGDGVGLPFSEVVDAEYSAALNRIVLVTAYPNRLIVLEPESGSFDEVELPLVPSSVSVHPQGLSAAVGHDGYVTLVELDPVELADTFMVSTVVGDVVLAGNGYIYAFPPYRNSLVDPWVALHSIEIATGEETVSDGLRANTVARLHPADDRMYGVHRGVSPADVGRYDIANGTATHAYDSPHHGDYDTCGGLWIAEDGDRIFTACGNVFRASNVEADDMKYIGALEGASSVRHADHSAEAKLIALLHTDGWYWPGEPLLTGNELSLHGDDSLNSLQTVALPGFVVADTVYRSEGRFVFFNAQGTRLYVLVEPEGGTPHTHVSNYGLVRYTIGGEDGDGAPIEPVDEPPPPPAPSPSASGSVQLDVDIIDAEYSRALDRIIAVSTSPDQLLILDPTSGDYAAVALSLTPAAVSLHPDGEQAVVGHDGLLSLVDLLTAEVTQTLAISTDAVDVVYAGNGYVHAFPRQGQWEHIRSIAIATGVETLSGDPPIHAGTVARLNPAGDRMYGANRDLSPDDIERYDITGGPAVYTGNAPHDGDYASCGNLWFSEDGARIITACGNAFRASNVEAEDMTYNGSLEGYLDDLLQVDHSSAAGYFAAVGSWDDHVVLFADDFLTYEHVLALPYIELNDSAYGLYARFAFFSADGAHLFVIAEAQGKPLVHSQFVLPFEL